MRVGLVVGAALLLMTAAVMPTAHAQDAAAPASKPTMTLDLIENLTRVDPSTPPRDALRDLPPPPADRPSQNPPFTVIVGDPQCLPGEAGFVSPDPRLNTWPVRPPRRR